MLRAHLEAEREHDPWLHERHRYDVLAHVYRNVRGDCELPLHCGRLADELGLTREETFRILHELEHRGFLSYLGSGPRVRITPLAVAYLLVDSGRRHSIRDIDSAP